MIRLPAALALAAAALAAPAALAAQDPAPRDTIVIVPRDAEAASTDTLVVATDEAPTRRPSRRGQPFAVRSSGRVAPHAPPRDVVWMHPDSIRRAAPETADSVPADTIVVASADEDAPEGEDEVLLDTASADGERPARRRTSTTGDEEAAPSTRRRASTSEDDTPPSTRRRTTSTADEDAPPSTRRRNTDAEEEDAPPATRRRTAAADADESDADAEPAPRRTTRSGARADSASTRRTATTTRPAARDSAARRAAAATTRTTPAAGARARSHTVAAGESLFGIARRYGVTTAQLRALNPDVEWERLKVGTDLRLPAAARAPAQSGQRATATGERATTPARPAQTQRGRRSHTVESGETVYGLARRYGVTAAAIREANDLDEDARLRIGQTLVIPRAPQQ